MDLDDALYSACSGTPGIEMRLYTSVPPELHNTMQKSATISAEYIANTISRVFFAPVSYILITNVTTDTRYNTRQSIKQNTS